MLESILSNTTGLSIGDLFICCIASIVLGLIISLVHMNTSRYSKNFLITLAVLPVLVQSIMMMVNGNLGTSIAIVGAFSLVRFRSIPGTSKEILSVFFAMTIGLATGMGQIWFAIIITILVCSALIILSKTKFGVKKQSLKILKVTIPDNMDYTEVFDEVFDKYISSYNLDRVKTVNLGSLIELTYTITLKKNSNEKEFLDDLRLRNGNLKIIITHSLDDSEL